MTVLNSYRTLDQFASSLNEIKPVIGPLGGRYFHDKKSGKKLRMNDIVKDFEKTSQLYTCIDEKKTQSVINKIRMLDQKAQNKLNKSNFFVRIMTVIRQFFGNLFYDKYAALLEVQFPLQKSITSVGNYRLLPLKGDNGAVSCRVRGISANTIPSLSENWAWEHLHETYLRVRNLIAFRGSEEGARMIGPCDYYGNIEKPHKYAYTIRIDEGMPVILQHDKKKAKRIGANDFKPLLPPPPITLIKAQWISGKDKFTKQKPNDSYQQQFGESLFKTKGILKVIGGSFEVKKFDATKVDLSAYDARLVKNDTPFHITDIPVPASDDFRAVSYQYQGDYAAKQIDKGGGLFLESHPFAQTITPLDNNSGGFVTLAKWKDPKKEELEVIAVEIPYGYTLVIEEYCIHGDANLDGMFMMCMTTNHDTMNAADTVFLKDAEGKKNITVTIQGGHKKSQKTNSSAPLPIITPNATAA